MNQSKSNLADPGTLPQDTFAVLCTMDDANKIEVQKFSWVAETGPFYEVPESLADSEQHPHILKYLNSSKMKPKGRRNAKMIIRKKNSKTGQWALTTAGALYLNRQNQFVINGTPLVKESAFNASQLMGDLLGLNDGNKSLSAAQILERFRKFIHKKFIAIRFRAD